MCNTFKMIVDRIGIILNVDFPYKTQTANLKILTTSAVVKN